MIEYSIEGKMQLIPMTDDEWLMTVAILFIMGQFILPVLWTLQYTILHCKEQLAMMRSPVGPMCVEKSFLSGLL